MNNEPIFAKNLLSSETNAIPLKISWGLKWPVGIGVISLFLSTYYLNNHFHFFPLTELGLSIIDLWIPFIPEAIWIYASIFVYVPFAYSLNRCVVSLNVHIYSFLFLIVLINLIFIFFPVVYPRSNYLLPAELDRGSRFIFQLIRDIDTTASCLPSFHVSIAFLVAFGFLDDRKEYFYLMLSWAILIAFSTLFVKQHYAVDVLGGFLVAWATFWIFHRKLKYRGTC